MATNRIVHWEIIGKDGPALHKYYSDLFGWNVQQVGGAEMGFYGMVDGEQTGVGGGIGLAGPDGGTMGVMIYVGVDDIQGALDKAVSLGGKVIQPVTTIPNMVTFAQFSDPQGNVVGLVDNKMPGAG
jgi:predicted enzyme related to lactoylglutathione lyase